MRQGIRIAAFLCATLAPLSLQACGGWFGCGLFSCRPVCPRPCRPLCCPAPAPVCCPQPAPVVMPLPAAPCGPCGQSLPTLPQLPPTVGFTLPGHGCSPSVLTQNTVSAPSSLLTGTIEEQPLHSNQQMAHTDVSSQANAQKSTTETPAAKTPQPATASSESPGWKKIPTRRAAADNSVELQAYHYETSEPATTFDSRPSESRPVPSAVYVGRGFRGW